MRLSQVANNIAVHSVSNLGSMDNVTVLIILLNNAPATCPVRLPSPITYHARTFNAIERRDNGENNSARWGAEAGSKSDYSSGTRGAPIPTVSAASSFKKEEVELDTYLDDDGHEAGGKSIHFCAASFIFITYTAVSGCCFLRFFCISIKRCELQQ